MRLVTTSEMRALEQAAFDQGVSASQLMERAGRAVGQAAAEWLANPRGRTALVLAGKGNNGGDALIAARVLAQESGVRVRIFQVIDRGDDPLLAWVRSAGVPLAIHDPENTVLLEAWLSQADVVLDGVLGIGARLPLAGAAAEVLRCADRVRPPGQRRIAVDIPSGVDADSGQADPHAFHAQLTLATGPAKPGLFIHPGAEHAGRVRALDIGVNPGDSTPAILRASAGMVAQMLPPRSDDSHKGTHGKVLVVAGCARYTGAAFLASAAAVRAGAGLVTLAAPPAVREAVASRSVETTYLPLVDDPVSPGSLTAGHLGEIARAARGYDAVVLGPGSGDAPATYELVTLLLEALDSEGGPRVLIDADGLNALSAAAFWKGPTTASWVLTPHPGEMSRLRKALTADVQRDRLNVALRAAAEWGQVVVLKGAPSITAAPDGTAYLNAFANAALGTAGTGDVLSGTIASLLAQGCSPLNAAVAGSYLHALAGELWRAEHGAAGLPAGQLVELLPQAQRQLRSIM